MIREIEALNYRCLKFVRQEIGDFQVLVGANASGKSTFLDVIRFLGSLVGNGLEKTIQERSENLADLMWQGSGARFEETFGRRSLRTPLLGVVMKLRWASIHPPMRTPLRRSAFCSLDRQFEKQIRGSCFRASRKFPHRFSHRYDLAEARPWSIRLLAETTTSMTKLERVGTMLSSSAPASPRWRISLRMSRVSPCPPGSSGC